MADYKELLRRAVEALPENNGAARRAVYEKARAALVGQLRAINPPLAARDITAHRLQLEDCIRQVEQEASEAVIAGLGSAKEDAPPPPPVYFEPPARKAAPAAVAKPVAKSSGSGPVVKPAAAAKEPPKPLPRGGSIEEIIAAANAEQPAAAPESSQRIVLRTESKPMGKPVPKLVPQSAGRAAPAAAAPAARAPVAAVEPEPDQDVEELTAVLAGLSNGAEPEPDDAEIVAPPPPPPQPKARVNGKPLPAIVAKAEAAKSRTIGAAFGAPITGAARGPVLEPRREAVAPRLEPAAAARGAARPAAQRAAQPVALFDEPPVPAAMSAVREVELESEVEVADPQVAIDRAIATLDREARGEHDDELETVAYAEEQLAEPIEEEEAEADPAPARNGGFAPMIVSDDAPSEIARGRPDKKAKPAKPPKQPKVKAERAKPERVPKDDRPTKPMAGHRALRDEEDDDGSFPPQRGERRGLGAVTIFLIVFAFLLMGAGGAAFWAWREGFIDLDQMFGRSASVQQQAAATSNAAVDASAGTPATGPGNTNTPTSDAPTPELAGSERLDAQSATLSPSQPLPLVPAPAPRVEERLGAETAPTADGAAAAVAAIDPAAVAGSQSLLLEASDNGTTGAVPFSGTVDWSRGTDEMGLPTLIGKASIPARNLGVDLLIRKNSDPSLPASHLMEINFRVSEGFIGGSIAGLPGVLLKNEELVRGQQLVGASARVVGNSFLFALSASPADVTTNSDLLSSRKWMDLALIYATGKRAIITLEKDDAAIAMFNEVVATWSQTASTSP